MNLDKNQELAVKTTEKKVLVIAAPGSGKTSVLLDRCLYLMKEGISPSHILLLTFTKSAADNMKGRLGIEANKAFPFIGTFHSFMYRVLKEKRKINIISEKEKDNLIRDILKEFQDDVEEAQIKEIKNEISKNKRNGNYNGKTVHNTFIYNMEVPLGCLFFIKKGLMVLYMSMKLIY